jgi:drug/metabolite transporter (DMT)-like permease
MQDQRTLPRSIYFTLLLLTLGWGCNWPMMKFAVSGMSPYLFRAYCVLAGAIGMFAIARVGGLSLAVPSGQWRRLCAVALFNITIWNVTSAVAVKHLPAGRSAVLAYTMPLWTVLLSWPILGERLTRRRALGVAFGMAGMLLLLGEHIVALRGAPLGTLLILCAAASWAIGTLLLKRYPIALPPTVLTGWQMLVGGAPIVVLTFWWEHDQIAPVHGATLVGLLYNLIVAAILCHWAWFKIVYAAPAAVASLSTLMIPVVGVFSSMLLLGERPSWQEYAALVLVVAAVATVLVRPKIAAPVSRRA